MILLTEIKKNRLSEEEKFILDLISDLEIVEHKKWIYYKKDDIPYFEYLLDTESLFGSFNHLGSIIEQKYKTFDYKPSVIKLFSEYYDVDVSEFMVMQDKLFYCYIL